MTAPDAIPPTAMPLAEAHAAWFAAAAHADRDAVRARCEALAAAFAADPDADRPWSELPAAQWAAETTGLAGYASLFNAALPARLATPVAAASGPGLPADVPGAWATRLDPGLAAEQRAGVDALLTGRVRDWRAEHAITAPEAGADTPAPDAATAFPPGFMPALTRLRQAALAVPPRAPSPSGDAADGKGEPRPERPLAELLDRLLELDDLDWRRPVTQKQVDRLEAFLGGPLPADYRAFLDRANGSMDREFAGAHEVAADARELLEYEAEELAHAEDPEAERARFTNDDGSGRVAPGGFVRGWLPIYDHGTGAFVILDCAPGPAGERGQILEYGEGETRVTHPDFRSWLQEHVEDLEA
ncbi:SMI1/KNR4 family protein [Micrococcus sp.]|uniref:SMI1/KNR4 family protein n=1 Tax=Micrococcus sp. TaxID=1271 RepID=UPI0026DCA959|nr:SMI1/KNR4 family protein [Micrococcus sp.]MDO4239244.1 SMI1/KNR4 family protein [Micrococcus sp.]